MDAEKTNAVGMKGSKDLTVGSPWKNILFFCIPILISNIFQQLYSMVDTIIVGQTISLSALAAVGCTGSISFLVIGFISGITSGFGVMMAQYFGAKNEENFKRSVGTCYLLSVLVAVVVTAIAVPTATPLLRLMKTGDDIIGGAHSYIVTIYYGIAATVVYNMSAAMLRAIGDSRSPLIFLIMASVLNIGMDFLCILVFDMGVRGAGVATVVSQLIAGCCCIFYGLKRYPVLRIGRRHLKWNFSFSWKHLKVGLPMALQFSITAIGIMVVQAVLNEMGTMTVAAYTAASKIDSIAQQPFLAMGAAIATYCAQNYGAHRFDRIKRGMKVGLLLTVIISVVAFVLVFALKIPLLKLFSDDYASIQKDATIYLYLSSGTYFFLGLIHLYRNGIQGMGFSAVTMLSGLTELVMRVVAALVFANFWGFIGVCSANPAAWFGAAVILLVIYLYLYKKRIAPAAKRQEEEQKQACVQGAEGSQSIDVPETHG